MSVKLGFNYVNNKVAISSITVEDIAVIKDEVSKLEDIVSSRSKQVADHVSMLDSVRASISLMEDEESRKAAEAERLRLENAQLLEERATHLSSKAVMLDSEVAEVEQELSNAVEVQLEMKLNLDREFADWYSNSQEYFNSHTPYTQANILQSNLPEITKKQEASMILSKELALDESTKNLLDIIKGSASSVKPIVSIAKIDNWHVELEVLKEESLSYGLYSANNPGEIVKRLMLIEEALWKLEQSGIKEEIEALVFSMKDEASVNKDKISSFREEIKELEEDAKAYKVYNELLYAWQVLDSIKPVEMQEAENQRHAIMLSKKQEQLAIEEEQKENSVMSHAFNEAAKCQKA